jgi:putative transposase
MRIHASLSLALTQERRQDRYRQFVEQGIPERELKFIRDCVQRNQLTGSEAFILEIEQRIGERILHRPRGRSRSDF